MKYDAVIVGGGPAGLSCALVLGRSCRTVLVCDSGHYRNAPSDAMHGYLTRDGIAPGDFLRHAREELRQYRVEYRAINVVDAAAIDDGFRITMADNSPAEARKLVLATGVVDVVPPLQGIDQFYGKSVHHCPYCDGWEHRDESIAIYGRGKAAWGLAREMLTWSRKLTIISDGPCELTGDQRDDLLHLLVDVREDRVARLAGTNGKIERIVFENGEELACGALFFCSGQQQRCDLPEKLGCSFNPKGTVDTDRWERTNVHGVYVIGDASRNVQFVIVAAAEGAIAAQRINADLADEDVARMLS